MAENQANEAFQVLDRPPCPRTSTDYRTVRRLSSCRLQIGSSWVESRYHTEKSLLGNHGNIQEALQFAEERTFNQGRKHTAVALVVAAAWS